MLVVTVLTGSQAAQAASRVPFDPSPYCRPYAGTPYIDGGPSEEGKQMYSFDVQADGGMHCNGAAYRVVVNVTLHYHTTEDGPSGATTGSTHTCPGSCEAWAHYNRNWLYCGVVYHYDDYSTTNWTWQKTSTSPTYSGHTDSGHSKGSSYNPRGIC